MKAIEDMIDKLIWKRSKKIKKLLYVQNKMA